MILMYNCTCSSHQHYYHHQHHHVTIFYKYLSLYGFGSSCKTEMMFVESIKSSKMKTKACLCFIVFLFVHLFHLSCYFYKYTILNWINYSVYGYMKCHKRRISIIFRSLVTIVKTNEITLDYTLGNDKMSLNFMFNYSEDGAPKYATPPCQLRTKLVLTQIGSKVSSYPHKC